MRNRSSAQTVDKVYIIRRVFYSKINRFDLQTVKFQYNYIKCRIIYQHNPLILCKFLSIYTECKSFNCIR